MELNHCKAALEAVLFAYAEPVSTARLSEVLGLENDVLLNLLHALADELKKDDRGLVLLQLEDRWQLSTKTEYGDYIKAALDTRRNTPLTPAALEVLAIVAYNQPVSRSFIDQVRGVDSSSVVQTLVQKCLIEEAGRLDLPGRPVAFKTTDVFLRTFGIASLAQLPALHDDDYAESGAADTLPAGDLPDGVESPEMAEPADPDEVAALLAAAENAKAEGAKAENAKAEDAKVQDENGENGVNGENAKGE